MSEKDLDGLASEDDSEYNMSPVLNNQDVRYHGADWTNYKLQMPDGELSQS